MEIKDADGEPHDIDRWLIEPAPVAHRPDHRGARKLPDPAGPAGGLLRDRDRPQVVPPQAPGGQRRQPRARTRSARSGSGSSPRSSRSRENTSGRNSRAKGLVSFAPWPTADASARQREDRACRGTPRPHGRGHRIDPETDPDHAEVDHDRPRPGMEAARSSRPSQSRPTGTP